MSNAHTRSSRRYQRFLAGATATLALGGSLAACGSSSQATTASTASTTASGAASTTAYSGTRQAPPGFGQQVTGAAAAKAKAAALAKYPGTVEQVMRLSDGSYVVHVMRSSGGEVHVKVSKAFTVTGVEQGMPGRGMPGGRSGMPPGLGKAVTGTAASKAKAAALARYPGTVERVVQLADGSYEVHVIRSSGSEVHVKVSKAFKVTGTEQGMPRPGSAPDATPSAPSGGGTTS